MEHDPYNFVSAVLSPAGRLAVAKARWPMLPETLDQVRARPRNIKKVPVKLAEQVVDNMGASDIATLSLILRIDERVTIQQALWMHPLRDQLISNGLDVPTVMRGRSPFTDTRASFEEKLVYALDPGDRANEAVTWVGALRGAELTAFARRAGDIVEPLVLHKIAWRVAYNQVPGTSLDNWLIDTGILFRDIIIAYTGPNRPPLPVSIAEQLCIFGKTHSNKASRSIPVGISALVHRLVDGRIIFSSEALEFLIESSNVWAGLCAAASKNLTAGQAQRLAGRHPADARALYCEYASTKAVAEVFLMSLSDSTVVLYDLELADIPNRFGKLSPAALVTLITLLGVDDITEMLTHNARYRDAKSGRLVYDVISQHSSRATLGEITKELLRSMSWDSPYIASVEAFMNVALEHGVGVVPVLFDAYPEVGLVRVAKLLERELGTDENAWHTMLALVPRWQASLVDLLAAVKAARSS